MRIAVCVKYVPVLARLELDPATRTLKRTGVPGEVSAFDVRALVKAVALREQHGGEVAVVTMGPPEAREGLLECLALGADRALHLCDRAFAGADTLATARALTLALRPGGFDLILCGRHSVDAETAQVGPELAELLGLPQVTAALQLRVDPATQTLWAEREVDDGLETVEAPLPAVVTATEDLAPERFPTKADREAAVGKPILTLDAYAIGADPATVGASGSPTWVGELHVLPQTRLGRVIEATGVREAATALADILVREHGLFSTWRLPPSPVFATIPAGPLHRSGARDVWVVAESGSGGLRRVTAELLGRAAELARVLGSAVWAVALGPRTSAFAPLLSRLGADRVLVADDPRLDPFDPAAHARALCAAIEARRPGIVLFPGTGMGRDLAPRVAARLGLGLTSDCLDVGLDEAGRLVQYKPAFGGSVVAPILSRTVPEMATIRPGMLGAPDPDPARPVSTERLDTGAILADAAAPRLRVLDRQPLAQAGADLDHAEVILGVGKGIGGPDQLAAIEPLARLLGAPLCATRDVTDAGWLPRHLQVGLTGRAIAPKLYVAIGIRGAFEHVAGVRRAGLVVAINRNARAPIFRHCDYGIVADWTAAVPALVDALTRARSGRS